MALTVSLGSLPCELILMIADYLEEPIEHEPSWTFQYSTLEWVFQTDGAAKGKAFQGLLRLAATCKLFHCILTYRIYRQALEYYPMILPLAVYQQNTALVARLLDAGANPNMRISSQTRYYHIRMLLGHRESRMPFGPDLLQVPDTAPDGEFVESRGAGWRHVHRNMPPYRYFWYPLHMAALNWDAAMVDLLLEKGARLNAKSQGICRCQPYGPCKCQEEEVEDPSWHGTFLRSADHSPPHVLVCDTWRPGQATTRLRAVFRHQLSN